MHVQDERSVLAKVSRSITAKSMSGGDCDWTSLAIVVVSIEKSPDFKVGRGPVVKP